MVSWQSTPGLWVLFVHQVYETHSFQILLPVPSLKPNFLFFFLVVIYLQTLIEYYPAPYGKCSIPGRQKRGGSTILDVCKKGVGIMEARALKE